MIKPLLTGRNVLLRLEALSAQILHSLDRLYAIVVHSDRGGFQTHRRQSRGTFILAHDVFPHRVRIDDNHHELLNLMVT